MIEQHDISQFNLQWVYVSIEGDGDQNKCYLRNKQTGNRVTFIHTIPRDIGAILSIQELMVEEIVEWSNSRAIRAGGYSWK